LTLDPDAPATPPKPAKVPKGKAPPKTAPKAKASTATTTPPPKALAGVTIRAEVLKGLHPEKFILLDGKFMF
jgi:hypothetical protein